MAFSLSNWFKGKPGSPDAEPDPAPAPAPLAPAAPPPAAVRTVQPKSAQPASLREPSARPPVTLTTSAPPPPSAATPRPVLPPARKISFPVPAMPSAASAQGLPPVPAPVLSSRKPAPALAPAPLSAPDAAVILEIGDFLDRLPPGLAQTGAVDRHRTVAFRAEELYADLTKGRASVPASVIYQKCPDIFSRPVTDEEDAEVTLPLQKLVEQLSAALQTRTDQVAEENVGEIETPFLQVALEDSARLPHATGTGPGAVRPTLRPAPAAELLVPAPAAELPVRSPQHRTGQISSITPPKLPPDPPTPPPAFPGAPAPATGPINPGKRPPSTVRASVAGGKIRLSGPSAAPRMVPAPAAPGANHLPPGPPARPSTASQPIALPALPTSPSHQVAKRTARIQIPPISLRPGGPGATPRPGTPTPAPAVSPAPVPVQPAPVTIRPPAGGDAPLSFRTTPPPATAKLPPPSFAPAPRPAISAPSLPTPPAAAPPPPAPAAAPLDERRIELGLAAVLRAQPASALATEPSAVPDDVRFSVPFAPIEPQLSQGRVSLGRAEFLAALPAAYQQVLAADADLPEVSLPLQEIFQNLPTNALSRRADQIVEDTGTLYPTPFSQKADEDAQRFGAPAAPPAEPEAAAPAAPVAEEEPVTQARVETPPPETFEPSVAEEAPMPAEPLAREEHPVIAGEPASAPAAEEAPAAPVAEIPISPVVEPPAALEPTPVEEALAVLESTAPAASDADQEAHAEAEAPARELDLEEVSAEAAPTLAPSLEEFAAEAAPMPAPEPVAARLAPAADDTVLQTLFMTEDEMDAKTIVRHVSQLPGVRQCAVMFADGLHLAGNFPVSDTEAFSAMAPPFFKRTQNFVTELRLGHLQTFTIHTDAGLLSFFMHATICVSVSHAGRGFLPGVREKLETVTRELARMYASAEPAAEAAEPSI